MLASQRSFYPYCGNDLDRPSGKDAANDALEKRLWAAADQLRANSGLKSSQYSTPVLGLIFLRFADARFANRYPFGLPRTDNANYLWIQLFHSALRGPHDPVRAGLSEGPPGRAGFVMANSASDACASEQEIRRQPIEARSVDVMGAVGPNLF